MPTTLFPSIYWDTGFSMYSNTKVDILSISKTYSNQQGWVGVIRVKIATLYVEDFVAAYANMAFPGTGKTFTNGAHESVTTAPLYPQQFHVEPQPDSPAGIAPTGSSDGPQYIAAINSIITIHYAFDYRDWTWPNGFDKPDFGEGTTLKLRTKFSGQFLTLPPRAMAAIPADQSAPHTPVSGGYMPGYGNVLPPPGANANNRILIPTMDFLIEWDRVPADKFSADYFQSLIGKVNDDWFLGQYPETLLFDGVEFEPSFAIDAIDPRRWKVQVTLKGRMVRAYSVSSSSSGTPAIPIATVYGWNHDFHENPPGWARVIMADGFDRYAQDDFSQLFTYEIITSGA